MIPGAFMGSLLGLSGQWVLNRFDKQPAPASKAAKPPGPWQKVADSGWMPIQSLSDDKYADMLKERQLKLQAEISVIDDDIIRLRKMKEESLSVDSKK